MYVAYQINTSCSPLAWFASFNLQLSSAPHEDYWILQSLTRLHAVSWGVSVFIYLSRAPLFSIIPSGVRLPPRGFVRDISLP
jgi:hypothetical protein